MSEIEKRAREIVRELMDAWPKDHLPSRDLAVRASDFINALTPAPAVDGVDAEPVGEKGCSLGVGCDEAGVCYASAHNVPDQCPKSLPATTLEHLSLQLSEATQACDQYAGLYAERCLMLLEAQCEWDAARQRIAELEEVVRMVADSENGPLPISSWIDAARKSLGERA